MTIFKPELVTGDRIPMAVTNPRHLLPQSDAENARLAVSGSSSSALPAADLRQLASFASSGTNLAALGDAIGADQINGAGSFQEAMLKALDEVNADQAQSTKMFEALIVDPDSVDAHDVTIAMAKANLSLNISRTVLNRIVSAWKDIINTR